MANTAFKLTVEVTVVHPDGTKVSPKEVSMRASRLLDEYENTSSQPDDFFLTDPTITEVGVGSKRR